MSTYHDRITSPGKYQQISPGHVVPNRIRSQVWRGGGGRDVLVELHSEFLEMSRIILK
jgi:hypothetical protein